MNFIDDDAWDAMTPEEQEKYLEDEQEEIEENKWLQNAEIANDCKCGALGFDEKTGDLIMVADCCCGAL